MERIQDDYDQPIDNQAILCEDCNCKNKCTEDDDCQMFIEMSEGEKEIEISKPDYVSLDTEN